MATTNRATSTGTKGNGKASTAPEQEKPKKATGGYKVGYKAADNLLRIDVDVTPGKAIDKTDTGKPVFARNEGRLHEIKTTDGRLLRVHVYVDEVLQEAPKAVATTSTPAGVSEDEWAAFQQFQAWQKAQGK